MKRGRFTTIATTFAAVLSLLSVSLPSQAGTAGAEVLALASNCALPVVHDKYDGFHIGVPAGWDLSTLGGDITVSPNLAGPEGDIVYPALLTKGVTAGSVLTGFMGYVQGLVRKSAGVFNYQMRTAANGLPVASVNEKVSGALLSGAATVSVLTLKTQMASNEAVVSFYYAPRDSLRADAATLSRIASCYGPEHATLFELFNQQPQAPFAFIEPPGWHIGTEGQDDFELENSGDTASATYDFWGPLVQGVNVSQPLSTPAEAIAYWFGKLGFENARTLWTVSNATVQYMEFTTTLNGKDLRGLIYMNISSSNGSTAGVFRLALASSPLWDSLNGALIEMAGSIQHDFSQDLAEIQNVNREWQDFSGQVANFDDTLNNQQLVQDPSTGTLYEAPYSSYEQNGPRGPATTCPSAFPANLGSCSTRSNARDAQPTRAFTTALKVDYALNAANRAAAYPDSALPVTLDVDAAPAPENGSLAHDIAVTLGTRPVSKSIARARRSGYR